MSKLENKKALPPFSCKYSAQLPELLNQLGCTVALSTYQAGKLVLISAKDEHTLVQLPRHFEKVMGIAEDKEKDKLALACKDALIVFANSASLAKAYPKAPNKYDSLYMPRMTYHTGALDIHDVSFGKDGRIFAVNTLFSCLVELDDDYSFRPYWVPSFIDRLVSEDRCHLNGMAMEDGLPRYATAFNTGNSPQSWRDNITKTGVVFDLKTGNVLAEGLAMPHSPRILNGELYVLLSATGELARIDRVTGAVDIVCSIGGFVRGMSLCQDYLFIGLSKLRKNSSTFSKLDFAEQANQAGIAVVHLPTRAVVGKMLYANSLDEIYDVHILEGKRRPNILNTITQDYKMGLMTPESSYWAKPS